MNTALTEFFDERPMSADEFSQVATRVVAELKREGLQEPDIQWLAGEAMNDHVRHRVVHLGVYRRLKALRDGAFRRDVNY